MVICIPIILRSSQLSSKSCCILRLLCESNRKTIQPSWEAFRSIHSTPKWASAAKNLERKYTDKHEWVIVDGKIGTVGVSQYAQDALGDVVYAQLPDIGLTVEQNEECGALESVKAASELYCPVSGKVVEKNTAVEDTPGLINQSCYDKGWLFKVELTKTDELAGLMNEVDYEKFLKSDPH